MLKINTFSSLATIRCKNDLLLYVTCVFCCLKSAFHVCAPATSKLNQTMKQRVEIVNITSEIRTLIFGGCFVWYWTYVPSFYEVFLNIFVDGFRNRSYCEVSPFNQTTCQFNKEKTLLLFLHCIFTLSFTRSYLCPHGWAHEMKFGFNGPTTKRTTRF